MPNWYNRYVGSGHYAKDFIWSYVRPWAESALGYTQYKNQQASSKATIDYEQYLKAGNERALRDWHKNVKGRTIKYPEFSYPGAIYRSDTSIATAGFSYDNAYANYSGNLGRRAYGLYGLGSGLYNVPSHSYSRYL